MAVSVKPSRGPDLKLPPGFRFHPTDAELVEQYLMKKTRSCPFPSFLIPEIELSRYDPWDLPGNDSGGCSNNGFGKQRYFFNSREAKYRSGSRSNRTTASGYWKATGKDRHVLSSRDNKVIGMKKALVFYKGKPPHGSRTDWVMHEYRLHGPVATANKGQTQEWVLCRIFLKKSSSKNGDIGVDEDEFNRVVHNPIRFIDFMRQGSSVSAPEQSCVTDVSEDVSNDEVVSSS